MSDSIRKLGNTRLLGTVHASLESRTTVQDTIATHNPDVVAVELNPRRHHAMRQPNSQSTNLSDLTSSFLDNERSLTGSIVQYLFTKNQARIFSSLNIVPGEADMLPAVDTAIEQNAGAALIDSDIEGVMESIGDAFSPKQLLSHIVSSDIRSVASSYTSLKNVTQRNGLDQVSSFEQVVEKLELMPYSDFELLINCYETLLPDGSLENLLYERNRVMAGHITWLQEQGHSIIAVMGRMHVPGIESHLQNPSQIPRQYIKEPPYVTKR